MVKKAVSCVPCLRRSASRRQVASLRPEIEGKVHIRSLLPRLWKGASWRAGVGWMRAATFLTTLHCYPEMCLKSA